MMEDVAIAAGEHDPFSGMQVPPELEESLQRHRHNLLRLIMTLRSAGVDEKQIEESVLGVVASYKEELMRAIKRMMNDRG